MIRLPLLPARDLLADLSKETAAREGIEPALAEKDFYLTRLLWGLGQELGETILLKGGTLLSKVDLEFFRMSEDADMVIPGTPSGQKSLNARAVNRVRDALMRYGETIGVRARYPGGTLTEKAAHAVWELAYPSDFGPSEVRLEVSIRPVLRPVRRTALRRLLRDPLVGDCEQASCWALDANEVRAEKVRAAFTREAIRDYYDLDRLFESGADFASGSFVELVDAKLAELERKPLREQPPSFALDAKRRRLLEAGLKRDLPAVLRRGAPPFDLDRMLAKFDRLWHRTGK